MDKPGFFEKLLRFSFLLSGLSGMLRLYGAFNQQADILMFSGKGWLLPYLALSGGLMGVFNLTIWILLQRKVGLPAFLPAVTVLANILGYWLERMTIWAPAQRGTNAGWVIGTHLCWLLLAVLGFWQQKERQHEREQPGD